MPEQARKRPAKEVRIGSVKAAIRPNETEHGTRYNITFERLTKMVPNGRGVLALAVTNCWSWRK
jgi:hypothetical protein